MNKLFNARTMLMCFTLMCFMVSFTCVREDDNPKPNNHECLENNSDLKALFERGNGNWKCYYSDSNYNRTDVPFLASSTAYNRIVFTNGYLREYNFFNPEIRIDSGYTNFTGCGRKLIVKTNLSEQQPDSVLVCNVLLANKSFVKMKLKIIGVPNISYFTMFK